MQELIDSLERCVRQSTFVSDRLGSVKWNIYRNYYSQRTRNDGTRILLAASKLEVADKCVEDLAAKLDPILAEFTNEKSGRFGNGLFLLLGGSGKWAQPSVTEFARDLIVAAVRLSAPQVVELLLGWTRGEPLTFKVTALLDGARIDGPLHLAEGIDISKLPSSSADLPASLPASHFAASDMDFMGGIVMSIDCEMSPALFLPDENKDGLIFDRRGRFQLARNLIPNLTIDTFCESISLACNGSIDWFVEWNEFGNLEAIGSSSTSSRSKLHRSHTPATEVSQADLDAALNIQKARFMNGKPRESLELSVRRWIRSKRAESDLDKLIELRIALELLYEIGGSNEKAFRIATYGAWHLGTNFEQRRQIRETLRKAYADSSSVIHGEKIKHAKKEPTLVSSAQDICRNAILKRLEEEQSPKWDEIILGPHQ